MKKLSLTAAILIVLVGCKKELVRPDHIDQDIDSLNAKMSGHYYNVKDNIFNKGVFQPTNPVLVTSVYFDHAQDIPYATIVSPAQGDTVKLTWYIPVEDLK